MESLSIGNYVEYAGVLCEILGINQNGYLQTNGVEAPKEAFNFIKITDDLLCDIGYNKNKEYFKFKSHTIYKYNDMYLCIKNRTILTYLHEIQNLLWFTKCIKIKYPSKHYI